MPRDIPLSLLVEKNSISTPAAWLVLLDITLPDGPVMRLVRNNEDVIYKGKVYTAVGFDIKPSENNARGEIPTLELSIPNQSGTLQYYIEQYDGGVGATVLLTIVNSEHLDEDYTELEMLFDVLDTDVSGNASFTLGAPNPLRKRFPLYRAIARHCNWKFLSVECGYIGDDTTCLRTLDACRAKGNANAFGGRPGLVGNVRLA